MDDRRALMAAIIANPEEDTPRLVLADWLQEHGNKHDQARAEFIRLQIQLANTKPGKARDELSAAADKLESKHRKAWLKPLADVDPKFAPADYIHFQRGLLSYLWLDCGDVLLKKWRTALPEAVAAVGVEELCSHSATTRVAEYVRSPVFRRVARTQYPGANDKMLEALATAPDCAHLSGINFQEVELTDAGLTAFAQTTGTSRLRSVTISTVGGLTNKKAKFTAAGIGALLNSDRLPRLEFLELETASPRFDPGPLFACAGLQKLKTLWLSCRARMADVVASRHLTNLTTLIVHETELTDADADALVGPKFAKLGEVVLSVPEHLSPATQKKLKKRFGKGLTLEYEDE
jgi:uncharacterized protein (TIGR02996 family)